MSNRHGEKLEVYNLDAELIAVIDAPGLHRLPVPAGTYLVSGEDASRKVVVK